MINLSKIEDIDLTQNGIIEASAGTGKTYTIQELVKRIILETEVKPEEILVLTFTEKATIELKERIRDSISEERWKNQTDIKKIKLEKAFTNFDDFNIFTIHGFCNSLIKNYPFELNVPINAELSVVPFEIILSDLILKELPVLLENKKNLLNIELNRMKEQVIEIRKNLSFEKGHILKVDSFEFSSSNEVKERLKNYSEVNSVVIGYIIYYFVLRLFEEEKNYKERNWIITYDDMIEKVYQAIQKNESFRKKVSNLYKYIIIDEFQDTDLLQWNIFKKLIEENKNLRIYIVGDPKQAIYGFRGGDIHTYYKAKKEINGKEYILKKNYRSIKEIVDNLNTIFSVEEEDSDGNIKRWFANNEEIEYEKVEANENDSEKYNELQKFNLYKINSETPKKAYEIWQQFVVNEIIKLINKGIKKSDILILCRTGNNAKDYEKILKSKGIKAYFYEREGSLLSTKEAKNLSILLLSLSFPEDIVLKKTLLVSEIFGIEIDNLNSFLESKEVENFNNLFLKWVNLSRNKEWAKLFDSVFFDSGMINRLYKNYGEEVFFNYLKLVTLIKDRAYNKDLNIFSLYSEFEKIQKEESIKRYFDNEEDFVKIMTIHASKGLQSDVVFLGDGFTTTNKYPFYKYYEDEKYHFVIRVDGDDEEEIKRKHNKERDAEDERLFYVALTRAKFLLYFAIANVKKSQSAYVLCKNIKECVERSGVRQVGELTYEVGQELGSLTSFNEEIDEEIDIISTEIDFDRRNFLTSFSSIHKRLDSEKIVKIEISGEDEDQFSVNDNLPSGTIFGTFLHEILEEIDFKIVKESNNVQSLINNPDFNKFLSYKIKNFYPDRVEIFDEVAKMVFLALKKKISNFSLSEIENKKSELEFYLRLKDNLYLTGAIDLVFEYESKFYLVDWKTNILEEYEGENFIQSVEKSYGLQYRIYYLALMEYLKNFYKNPEEEFGGVFYIYLRGLEKGGVFENRELNISEVRDFVLKKYNEYMGKGYE